MTQTALTRQALRQPIPGDARVLATRPLRAAARLEDTAVFDDHIWSLTPAMPRADRHSLGLDFSTLPAPFRDVAKQMFFATLTGDVPAGESVLAIGSIRRLFTSVRRFLGWAEGRVDRLAAHLHETVGVRERPAAVARLEVLRAQSLSPVLDLPRKARWRGAPAGSTAPARMAGVGTRTLRPQIQREHHAPDPRTCDGPRADLGTAMGRRLRRRCPRRPR